MPLTLLPDPPIERRQRSTRPFRFIILFWHVLLGRQSYGRRQDDRFKLLWHRHEPRYFALTFGILALCLTDAMLTLHILSRGGVELNPVMDVLIEFDTHAFVFAKLLMTAMGLAVLIVHANIRLMRIMPVGGLVHALLPMYGSLIFYELILLNV